MQSLNNYNPDVLSCLANLSNDEVFTSPTIANAMLDLLPKELWSNQEARFLDPVCKSGVFLREITKRLNIGLADQIPDLQTRLNHIFTNQVFGIAITQLTALMARRTLYCTKYANGKYSHCTSFQNADGNIFYESAQHTWKNGSCIYCGASEAAYSRGDAAETYAYNFIHPTSQSLTTMQFDVIIGNPPYQMGSDGGTRDIPVYNLFVEQAKILKPRFLCMIIPSRWMASGLGLSEFRKDMLSDRSISRLVDYPVASEVFSGVEIKGGVCYFLWENSRSGDCSVTTIRGDVSFGPENRDLREFEVFVRDGRALKILRKIIAYNEPSITKLLSVDKEFGWTSNFADFHASEQTEDIPIYHIKNGKRNISWINRKEVQKSTQLIDKWKVLIPKAGSDGGQKIPDYVLGQPLIAPSPSVCTQSFLFFYTDSKEKAESIYSYLNTRFFRFLVSLRKLTQDATRSTYTWVPQQSWEMQWTDEKLYKKYGLDEVEIEFIESMIRPMA